MTETRTAPLPWLRPSSGGGYYAELGDMRLSIVRGTVRRWIGKIDGETVCHDDLLAGCREKLTALAWDRLGRKPAPEPVHLPDPAPMPFHMEVGRTLFGVPGLWDFYHFHDEADARTFARDRAGIVSQPQRGIWRVAVLAPDVEGAS
ncbi:MAG TPA: hypothetical protein VF194_06300 [Ferrovibrio sp.]|uniref:hypothetical protein n=1 Tax=Ferrovibrio sp. TaxID=1917215 RepID=UPI002ED39151